MGYQLICGPLMLLETVEMLFKYVNGFSFLTMMKQKRQMFSGEDDQMSRRMETLQEIMEDTCRDLSREDPVLQYYFGRVDTDCVLEDVCLARFMTSSFVTLRHTGFWEQVQEIRQVWRELQDRGAVLRTFGIAGLEFDRPHEDSGDLFEQIRALKMPGEFRLELYEVFRDFEGNLTRLAERLEPIAQRLESHYKARPWLMEGMVAQWGDHFRSIDPLNYLSQAVGENVIYGAAEATLVGFSLMSCDTLIYDMVGTSEIVHQANLLYIGSAVQITDTVHKRTADLENVAAMLKALADKRRLKVLHRLGKGRSYCHELAEDMDIDPGNMSRILTVLYNYGLLRQERDSQRIYYELDWDGIRNFLQSVEDYLRH